MKQATLIGGHLYWAFPFSKASLDWEYKSDRERESEKLRGKISEETGKGQTGEVERQWKGDTEKVVGKQTERQKDRNMENVEKLDKLGL